MAHADGRMERVHRNRLCGWRSGGIRRYAGTPTYVPGSGESCWLYSYDGQSGCLDKFYGGQIDDLRVYNYRRTPEQIAHEYFTVTGNAACTNPNFEGSAFNLTIRSDPIVGLIWRTWRSLSATGWLTACPQGNEPYLTRMDLLHGKVRLCLISRV